MKMLANEVKDLLMRVPLGGLLMDLQWRRLKKHEVGAVLQGCHIGVERRPFIEDEQDSTRSLEFSGDTTFFQRSCVGLPRKRLDPLRLTQCFEQPDAVAISPQTITIVQN